jgi:hypothetical protein
VVIFNENLFGPRGQRDEALVGARCKRGREYVQCLANDELGLGRVRLEQRVKHLEHDALVDGKFGDDVSEQEQAVVLVERIDARLGQQTRPGECHETTQLGALLFVVHVVDVVVRVLHKKRAQLQQEYAHRVRRGVRVVRIDDLRTLISTR